MYYSGTSDSGHSKEWTTSLQWTNCLPTTVCMLEPLKKGQPLNNGQNTRPQRVHCSEVPLYTDGGAGVQVNEAFAAQYVAVERELGLDREKTNTNGGAIGEISTSFYTQLIVLYRTRTVRKTTV